MSGDSVEKYRPEEPTAAVPRTRELEPWQRGVSGIEVEKDLSCPVLHPDHPFRSKWDLIQVFALLYVAVLVPVYLPSLPHSGK